MTEDPIQILEVRAGEPPQPVTVTAAVSADASRAIFVALSEQLDRRREIPITSADDALALREQVALAERFEPLATAGEHAVAQFTASELQALLVDVTAYAERVDDDRFQPPELRQRLETIAKFTGALWEANASATAIGGGPLAPAHSPD